MLSYNCLSLSGAVKWYQLLTSIHLSVYPGLLGPNTLIWKSPSIVYTPRTVREDALSHVICEKQYLSVIQYYVSVLFGQIMLVLQHTVYGSVCSTASKVWLCWIKQENYKNNPTCLWGEVSAGKSLGDSVAPSKIHSLLPRCFVGPVSNMTQNAQICILITVLYIENKQ